MDGNELFSDAVLNPGELRGTRSLLALSPELQAVVASARSRDVTWKLLRAAGIGFLTIVPALGLAIEVLKFFTGR